MTLIYITLDTGKNALDLKQARYKKTKLDFCPFIAISEAVLNALIHRGYRSHTQAMLIEVIMCKDRLEIKNLGGFYGRLTVY